VSEFGRGQNADPRRIETKPEKLQPDARSVQKFGPAEGE
jgi:hypothetical protein